MNEKISVKVKKKRNAIQRYLLARDYNVYSEYAKARNAAKAQARRAIGDYEKEIAKKAQENPRYCTSFEIVS